MFVSRIDLVNYRNYPQLHLNFEKGLNFICGPNASGKTNLIEAIYYLTLARSFKKAENFALIRQGQKLAQVRLTYFTSKNEKHELGADIYVKEKSITDDGEKISSVYKLVGKLLTVCYDPISVNLFRNEPLERRRVMDSYISLFSDKYLYALSRAKKLLKERNTALQASYDEDVIEVITREFANVSYRIHKERQEFISKLNSSTSKIYSYLFGKNCSIRFEYKTNVPNSNDQEEFITSLLEGFNLIKTEERLRKTTLLGVQRDDLKAYIDDKEAYSYASQGQNRLLALSLHLAAGEILEERFQEKPILLLDDVLSDLDEARKKNLIAYLKERNVQCFLTCSESMEGLSEGIIDTRNLNVDLERS